MIISGEEKKKLYGWRSKITQFSLTLGAGIHIIDLINWLTGLKPKTVYAIGNKKATRGTSFKKNSMIAMMFEYPKNIIVKITANGAAIFNHFHEIKIFSELNCDISKLSVRYIDRNTAKKMVEKKSLTNVSYCVQIVIQRFITNKENNVDDHDPSQYQQNHTTCFT